MNFLKFIFSKTFLKQLLIAFFVTILLIIGLFYWLSYYTNHDEYIDVPDLSKLEVDIVEKKLDGLNLNYIILDTIAYNPDFPPYTVVEQNPSTGQKVKENRKIYITLNPADYKLVTITENIYGKTLRQVIPSLKALGFKIGKITDEPDMAKDVVLKLMHNDTLVEEGSKLKKTSIIDIVVGDGSLSFEEQQRQKLQEQQGDSIRNDTLPKMPSLNE